MSLPPTTYQLNSMSNNYLKYVFIASTLLIAGCSVIQNIEEFTQQVETIDETTDISGKVTNESGRGGPIIAALLKADDNFVRVVSDYQVSGDGSNKFFALPGTYTLGAFVDTNNDGIFQHGEPSTYLGENQGLPIIFELEKDRPKKMRTLTIKKASPQSRSEKIVYNTGKALANIGRVVKLRDPMFSRDYAELGLWKPLDFTEKVGGGMFLLSKYREGRVPVVFVHGIKGTPLDWKHVIKGLDRTKFQPVVLHYPSGLPLDMISEFMLKAVNKLQSKHGFDEFYVVAHSMGGLVTRSFVKKYVTGDNPARIGMVMTINSPMMGIESAAAGVKYTPVQFVVPVFHDVAYKSDFIIALHEWRWPQDIPYHLVFSYYEDEANDGTVSLDSQIPRSLQNEASAMYGFRAEHAGLLKKSQFTRKFNSILLDNKLRRDAMELAAID